ncbi:MAG: dehydrogenase [uncultured archaeon A07HB70]|nr:MAG: dehydrogenase [uncultured archaeon A07HB70]
MLDLTPDLDGRTALVTGSATRVGRELLLRLADAGADVAVHYRTSEAAAHDTAAAARDRGVEATVVRGDVTDAAAVTTLVADAETALGGVDVLCNVVGNFPRGNWDELSPAEWRDAYESCLMGTYLCSRAVVPGMRERGWGRVVNFGAADAGHDHANPLNFPYFAAKKGVLMFTRALAYDTQDDGITVNAVSPFLVENSVVDADEASLPRGRPASFDDVAAPVLFFCSDAAAYVSGQNVAVDGGRLHEA